MHLHAPYAHDKVYVHTQIAKQLLSTLVKELAHDASANTVRVAVFAGLKYLVAQVRPTCGHTRIYIYI